MSIQLSVNGDQREFDDESSSLLDALRSIGLTSVKDGCSPQGQCGCCTVLVDGKPRVSCVTALRRVAGREITTLEGLSEEASTAWSEAFCDTGGSQCGFCTPGIIMRLEPLRHEERLEEPEVRKALGAHLCRCTGWSPIVEAAVSVPRRIHKGTNVVTDATERDLSAAGERAELEGGVTQLIGTQIALGEGGFADDSAPADALVAMKDQSGDWVLGETVSQARQLAGRVQGRATTLAPEPPIDLPAGEWDLVLQTCWVEPGYLETDSTWCEPGGEPASMLANGGAFGGKTQSELPEVARRLADESGRPVRVQLSREEVIKLRPKRPPLALGLNRDGSGHLRVAATPGVVQAVAQWFPNIVVTEVELAGPPTSLDLRAAIWAEISAAMGVLAAEVDAPVTVTSVDGAVASAVVGADGDIQLKVEAGSPLDEVVLRSYCIGAAHMATSWVKSEALAVTPEGDVRDLTIRSFGILKATEMPDVEVEIVDSGSPPLAVSDAAFAAVAGAVWRSEGSAGLWPTRSK